MVRVDLRTVTFDIPPQDLITRDNVPAKVNAVTYFRVVDPVKSVIEVERYRAATSQIAQTTLRSVLGKADLDMLLSERERLNEALQQIIDEQTDPWGIKVTAVEIKDVEIPSAMQRAMARQAEAERERRAKVINAEGEFQAAARLAEAAQVISAQPDRAAAALPADAARARLEPGVDDRLPAADRPPQAAAPGHAVRRHGEPPAADRRSRRGQPTRPTGRSRRPTARARSRAERAGSETRAELDAEVEAEIEAQVERVQGRGRPRPGRPRRRKP